MLRAVLFDLDNTLIRFDEREFFEAYIPSISAAFSDMMSPDTLLEKLLVSTQMLSGNDGRTSNAEHFLDHFAQGYEGRRDEIWERFIRFYETEFEQFRALVSVVPCVPDVFARLRKVGVRLVVASNPIWPLMVQMKRLAWAGLGEWDFDLVTGIENMSYCKPNVGYYLEICRKIGEKPEACLMVGNDPVNDLVVATIGMKTFLVTEGVQPDGSKLELSRSIRGGGAASSIVPDFTGPLSDVPDAVEALLQD